MKTSNNNSATEIDLGGHLRAKRGILAVGRMIEVALDSDLSITSHESDCRWKTANDKLISEVMSFVCSDSHKMAQQKKKCVRKDQANYLFQSISGSKATDWNFQSVKYLHELVQQHGGKKRGGQEAEFLERIRKESACLPHCGGSSWVSDFCWYLKVVSPTRKSQSLSKL